MIVFCIAGIGAMIGVAISNRIEDVDATCVVACALGGGLIGSLIGVIAETCKWFI